MIFRVKTLLALFTLIFSTFNISKAQIPSTCFEIESILVDACGSPEGENEMVRFIVGPNNLNVTNLTVNWPNNSFQGICQNVTTANKVATLNNTILGCGLLLEPTANILPAGSKVILITSTNFSTAANSFANLNDTLYVIFQCAGNTAGHFANYNSSSGIRTLNMAFSSPNGCSDMVSYDRSLLLNQSLNLGSGNGAKVNFAWNNTPTYDNEGCNAPISISNVTINSNPPIICPNDTILNLSATVNGSFQSVYWYGGLGNFSSSTSNTTDYYSSINDNNNFHIYFGGITTCGDTIIDSLLIQIGSNSSSVNISSSTTELCAGDSILLTANGTGNYTWSNNSSSNSIYVNTAGTYYVTSTTGCGSDTDTITITNALNINVTLTANNNTICQGDIATLTASGANNYTWFNSTTGTNTTVNTSGNYYVIGYNNCYQDSQSISITVIQPPALNINSNITTICNGDSAIITASGSNNYLWNTSDTSASITVFNSGTYIVTTSNSCFSVTDSIVILGGNHPIASIIGDSIFCNNIVLTASGGDSYLWSSGGNNLTETYNISGQIFVIATNSCGSDTAYHNIVNHGVNTSFHSDYIPTTETPVTVNFTNTSTNATNYFWTFGDGNTSNQTNPSNTYTEQESYNVVLTANNQYCSNTYEQTIIIESLNTVYLPNVFTPNGDGMNDTFNLKGENILSFTGSIYNRWGENIYNWENTNSGWDGTYKGKLVSDGTYFYLIKIVWDNNEKEILKGSITILK